MKYKVGDTVKIKSENWYKINRNEFGDVKVPNNSFVSNMAMYCGCLAKIIRIERGYYKINLDAGYWSWTDEMFDENMKETKIKLPEGWEVDRVENGEIILKESKKGLPKTWKDCLEQLKEGEYIDEFSTVTKLIDIIHADNSFNGTVPVGLGKPMLAFMQLLICREVYRQGWKPNWEDLSRKYVIECEKNKLMIGEYSAVARVLAFQSKEVRNAFLENFRNLIEEAKEFI